MRLDYFTVTEGDCFRVTYTDDKQVTTHRDIRVISVNVTSMLCYCYLRGEVRRFNFWGIDSNAVRIPNPEQPEQPAVNLGVADLPAVPLPIAPVEGATLTVTLTLDLVYRAGQIIVQGVAVEQA